MFWGSDGSISVSASDGTPGYTYLWDDPAGQTNATATNLAPGNYTVTVTDANGCQTTPAVTITEPAAALTATATKLQDVQCFGEPDGRLYRYRLVMGRLDILICGMILLVTVDDNNWSDG